MKINLCTASITHSVILDCQGVFFNQKIRNLQTITIILIERNNDLGYIMYYTSMHKKFSFVVSILEKKRLTFISTVDLDHARHSHNIPRNTAVHCQNKLSQNLNHAKQRVYNLETLIRYYNLIILNL